MPRHAAPAACAALLVLVGAAPRVLLAADVLPGPLRPFVWSDVLFTWSRGLAGGRVPYWDAYFEYPPLAGYVSALLSQLAPSAVAYVALWALVQAAAAAATALVLARTRAPAPFAFALAPELALFGPMNVDLLAVLALVVGARWAREGGHLRSVAALAVGTAVKLFPAAALPVALVWRPSTARSVALRVAVFAAVVAASYLPAAAAPYSSLESIGKYSVGIVANFDSAWGLAASWLTGLGIDPQGPILAITFLGLVVTYAALVLPAARAADPAVPLALATACVLLWSRLYSPQFSLWMLPFFALIALPRSAYVLLVAADVGVFATVYPLTLVDRPAMDPATPALLAAMTAAIVARHAALIATILALRSRARTRTTT